MKDFAEYDINRWRVRRGPMASRDDIGNYGAFAIPLRPHTVAIIIASEGEEVGWEHVSVHIRYQNARGKWRMRTPTWDEMAAIKDTFWHPEDAVMQLHPPESSYINQHPHCLHLWRPKPGTAEIPLPPTILVGSTDDVLHVTNKSPTERPT